MTKRAVNLISPDPADDHRRLVGGLWDVIGPLQLKTLIDQGLLPHHVLLDIACGCLRGGIHLINYLDAGHYFGVDKDEALLNAGYDTELARTSLTGKVPRNNLHITDAFEFGAFNQIFDRALAFSLFTHLPLNSIRECLQRLAASMKAGGVLHATFFEIPQGTDTWRPVKHEPGDIVTYGSADPYHYSIGDLKFAAGDLWEVEYVGEFGHPRAQRLVNFVRKAPPAPSASTTSLRSLSTAEAKVLPAGADHYRAYVGPPGRFDLMSATQFSLLFHLGLRENHRVLDFGCGALRLGRLLIPFLLPSHYFAIEPNFWLVEEGIDRELGRDAVRLKMPNLSKDSEFNCGVFGEKFDFIIAQSIITHAGPDQLRRLFDSASKAMSGSSQFLFSYIKADSDIIPENGWHYPECIRYREAFIADQLDSVGLHGIALPWYHPGASWHLATLKATELPSLEDISTLGGRIVGAKP